MKKRKHSIKEYFRDERNRKSFIVGLVVFIIVFIGLNLYQKHVESRQGDVILSGAAGSEEGDAAGGSGAGEGAGTGAGRGESPDGAGGDESLDAIAGEGAVGESGAGNGASAGDAAGGGSSNQTGTGNTASGVIFVDVGGAVYTNGLFALPAGSRVEDAIEAAGGLLEEAEMKYLNRAAVLTDGDRLYVPTVTEVRDGTAPPSVGQVTAAGGYTGGAAADPGANGSVENSSTDKFLVNLNTAGSEELQKLNGVGPATAQKIIDYRAKTGGFKRIEDIMNVSGIGAKTYEKLKEHITV